MAKKERRLDNLFQFTRRDARPSITQAELDEALATVLEAIERLQSKVDALIGKGA